MWRWGLLPCAGHIKLSGNIFPYSWFDTYFVLLKVCASYGTPLLDLFLAGRDGDPPSAAQEGYCRSSVHQLLGEMCWLCGTDAHYWGWLYSASCVSKLLYPVFMWVIFLGDPNTCKSCSGWHPGVAVSGSKQYLAPLQEVEVQMMQVLTHCSYFLK